MSKWSVRLLHEQTREDIMDLSYLLWLQGIRESLPGFVEQFFVIVSAIAASSALVVIPCLLYWCFNKRAGEFLVFSFCISIFVTNLVKSIVCCYRPWLRSPDIRPAEGALKKATGYSFPSGHSSTASIRTPTSLPPSQQR